MDSNSKTDWAATYASDVYLGAPNPEDGERREALAFYVTCENSYGDRYVSKMTFLSEDMGRDEAEKAARQLCYKVRGYLKRGCSPVGSAKWARGRAVYGSAAYSAYGEREECIHEIKSEGLAPSEEARLLAHMGYC